MNRREFASLAASAALVTGMSTVRNDHRDTLVVVLDRAATLEAAQSIKDELASAGITAVVLQAEQVCKVGSEASFRSAKNGDRCRVIADGTEPKHTVWADKDSGLICRRIHGTLNHVVERFSRVEFLPVSVAKCVV